MARRNKNVQDNTPKYLVRIPIQSLNSKPVHGFADYLSTNGRSTALRAFNEPVKLSDDRVINLDFNVHINKKDPKNCFFEIEFDAIKNNIDGNQLRIAELLLTQMRVKWEQGKKINLAFTKEFLETAVEEIEEHYSEYALGDKINVIFASAATNDNLSLTPFVPKEDDELEGDDNAPKTRITTRAPKEISLVEAAGYQGRGFSNSVQFSLAPWQKDDQGLFFAHHDETGDERRIYPTKNQQAYIDAMRDPEVKVVLVQAPSGSGKTLFAARIGLELLKAGAIKELLTERPTETTGGNWNPYPKGSMDEKLGVFNAVLEEEIALQLGHGDPDKGERPLKQLKNAKKIKRYDQMYQRGDTLRHAFLLGDEMQNKDRVEIFHLMSRPGEGAKVVLIGDAEYQNDLQYGRESGFMQAFNMFSNPEMAKEVTKRLKKIGVDINPKTVSTLRFTAEDIKRDPHTAYIYEMNRLADEMEKSLDAQEKAERDAERAKRKEAYQPPHPSERYHQHGNGSPAPGAPIPD